MPGPTVRRYSDKAVREFARTVWKKSGKKGSSRPLYRALKRSGEPKLKARGGR
jgi:hypothetical protein